MMTIGKIPVKHSYKPARIISDAISLVEAFVILYLTIGFFPRYKNAVNTAPNIAELLAKYRYSLSYRQYFAWIFPALAALVFAVYAILVLKSHRMEKFSVTKQNAQSVYDWYTFAASLCKIPILMGVFDAMYITQQRLMFNRVSLFSVQFLLDAVIVVIIIRLSVHRIRWLTETDKEKSGKAEKSGGVRARLADDDKDNKE